MFDPSLVLPRPAFLPDPNDGSLYILGGKNKEGLMVSRAVGPWACCEPWGALGCRVTVPCSCVAEAAVHHPGAGAVLAVPQLGRGALHRYGLWAVQDSTARAPGAVQGTGRAQRELLGQGAAGAYREGIFLLREEAGQLVHCGPQVRGEADHPLNRGLGWSVPIQPLALHRTDP